MGTLGVPVGCPAGRGHGWPALPVDSRKGRGVCPSCNGRRMAQAAAHLVDRVIPPVPVRQWVISVPKRLRCFLADRPSAVAALTRIFIGEIERLLRTAAGLTRDGDQPCPARRRLGAVSFLHRFGSALNHHVHLHVCATDGVFVPTGDVRPTQGGQLGRLGARAEGHAAGRQRRRRAFPFEFLDRLADLVPPPVSPARGPPADWGELLQAHFRPGNLSGDG